MHQERVLFGAAYYHEYQPNHRLEDDLDLMVEAKFSIIRIGEATWARWEPQDGVFELDWMQPVLDGAHARGLKVVMGTPTFAAPMWLTRKYPDIAIKQANGSRMSWGAREEMDYSHAAFKFHAERVTRKIVARYKDHPAVIGYQIHNEPGLHLFYNQNVFEGFRDHLAGKYGDVQTLNKEWGLAFWSHELSNWSDLWEPSGNAQPQYDLAWRNYQAKLTQAYIEWLGDIVRGEAAPGQFITTDVSIDRSAVDEPELASGLDVVGTNPYYLMQDGFLRDAKPHAKASWLSTPGPWSLTLQADRSFATKQAPFLVFETNAGGVGGPADNFPPYDGQMRQAAWAMVARGANLIEYWHWQSLHYGTETYWIGVMPHDQRPGRIYHEAQQVGLDLEKAGERVVDLQPDADVAFLWSVRSKWGLSFQPHRADDVRHPHYQRNERSYQEIFESFYRGAHGAGLQTRLVHDRQLVTDDGSHLRAPADFAAEHPVLVVPGLYVADDALLGWLATYVEEGGHLVLGAKSAYADHEARPRLDTKPARFSALGGVSYQEFSSLNQPVGVTSSTDDLALSQAHATDWLEYLVASEDAQTLATYDHPQLRKFAAVVSKSGGGGRVTTVGTLPDTSLATALMRWAVPEPLTAPWLDGVPESVTVQTARNTNDERIVVLHNWSWHPQPVTVAEPVSDLLSEAALAQGEKITLGAWDVRVLVAGTRH